jgi:G3E family GTPase
MIPVTLLTGFLGSGKTTLLQRLLTDPEMANAAVLINEFGEVGLDHDLLDRIDDTVVLMKSGCICCTVRGEIADALMNLNSLRARGEIAFDRVVIETTGLADPYPVLQTLRAHPVLRSHFVARGVLTTVDSVNAAFQIRHRAEAVRQIAAADRVILTKTDLAAPDVIGALRTALSRLNPTARVVTSDAPTRDIVGGIGDQSLFEDPGIPEAAPDETHGPRHHHAHAINQDLGVVAFAMTVDEPVDWTDFGIWLTLLLHRYGDRIFRVKGILAIAGETEPVAIHGVQHLVHAPVHMTHWPTGPRCSRIVFILEDIDPDLIRRSFRAFMRLKDVRAVA